MGTGPIQQQDLFRQEFFQRNKPNSPIWTSNMIVVVSPSFN